MKPIIPLLILVLPSASTFASSMDIDDSYWRCSAQDSLKQQWYNNHSFEIAAKNMALDSCKKQSQRPESCISRKEFCEYFNQGKSTKPLWRCTALDLMAKAWPSQPYQERDDAAIAAREFCQKNSAMPETCYINLLTCKNLAERN